MELGQTVVVKTTNTYDRITKAFSFTETLAGTVGTVVDILGHPEKGNLITVALPRPVTGVILELAFPEAELEIQHSA